MKEALFYIKEKSNITECKLCPHNCKIKDGASGFCGVRENIDGTLYTKTYNKISSIALDPIEKKPLRNYKPGTNILSVGTYSCNFKCDFCQNHQISQQITSLENVSVQKLLNISNDQTDSIGIAFTYNEPTIWYEYVREIAQNNTKDTVLVTNGYINKQPLIELLPNINAMNIDLKSMNTEFYRKVCGGELEYVQDTIKTAYSKTHIELTFLAIPNKNDSEEEMQSMAKWISDIDNKIPLHIIPFRPTYKWSNMPYQSYEKIAQLKKIASKKLMFVY